MLEQKLLEQNLLERKALEQYLSELILVIQKRLFLAICQSSFYFYFKVPALQ